MILCPWRFSTESSFGALPTRQGQGIVPPLHLKVIYGQEFIPNEFQDSGKIEIVSDHGIKAKKAVFHSPYSIDI